MDFLKSPFNYTGTKFFELEELFQYFPKGCDTIVDLFCGGGSVFINAGYKNVIANDIIKPLIYFYIALRDYNIEDILECLDKVTISKDNQEEFLRMRETFNQEGAIDPFKFFSLCSSCTNNMMRFNKKFLFNQTFGKRSINDNTIQKLKDYSERIKSFDSIKFENKQYYEVEIPENSFVYLDPPYLITEAGYNCYWNKELEEKLYEYVIDLDKRGIKWGMSNMLSHKGVNNPFIDKILSFNVHKIESFKNKAAKQSKAEESTEVFITNF